MAVDMGYKSLYTRVLEAEEEVLRMRTNHYAHIAWTIQVRQERDAAIKELAGVQREKDLILGEYKQAVQRLVALGEDV